MPAGGREEEGHGHRGSRWATGTVSCSSQICGAMPHEHMRNTGVMPCPCCRQPPCSSSRLTGEGAGALAQLACRLLVLVLAWVRVQQRGQRAVPLHIIICTERGSTWPVKTALACRLLCCWGTPAPGKAQRYGMRGALGPAGCLGTRTWRQVERAVQLQAISPLVPDDLFLHRQDAQTGEAAWKSSLGSTGKQLERLSLSLATTAAAAHRRTPQSALQNTAEAATHLQPLQGGVGVREVAEAPLRVLCAAVGERFDVELQIRPVGSDAAHVFPSTCLAAQSHDDVPTHGSAARKCRQACHPHAVLSSHLRRLCHRLPAGQYAQVVQRDGLAGVLPMEGMAHRSWFVKVG